MKSVVRYEWGRNVNTFPILKYGFLNDLFFYPFEDLKRDETDFQIISDGA